jgi:ABC-type Fe3+/spermidine/putrescine transport system ATPase subunit
MIEAKGLTKRYGATVAVDDLSFTVPPGQVTGFLGPNGAGKSTTMRLILGLDAPEEIGALARADGLTLTGLTADQATLEDRYMELTRDAADYRAAPGEPATMRK